MKQTFMVQSYIPGIWKRRPGGYFNTGKSVLLMDSVKSHIGDQIDAKFTECMSKAMLVHAGMTPLLQFKDTHINKAFKDDLTQQWEDWLESGEMEYTESGNRRRASYELVCTWVNDAWRRVATDETILKGFRECCYIYYKGDINALHSRLQETIRSRQVPLEIVLEIDNFIKEMRAIEADEVEEEIENVEEGDDESDDSEEDEMDDINDADDEDEIVVD